MASLREKMLELLEKDKEFRYMVAGYLGLSEIMRRLDALSEEQVSLRKEQIKLREEQTKIWNEMKGLREEQVSLREEQVKLREEQIKLREDFNKMLSIIRTMDSRLSRVEKTLEKLTLDIEEEARSILTYRVKEELGVEIELRSLILPDLELNIYGVADDICIIGEASVRAGIRVLNSLLEKIEKLKANYPEKIRRQIIPVIYTSLPMPDLIERAREKKIWVLKATGDFVKPNPLKAETKKWERIKKS